MPSTSGIALVKLNGPNIDLLMTRLRLLTIYQLSLAKTPSCSAKRRNVTISLGNGKSHSLLVKRKDNFS